MDSGPASMRRTGAHRGQRRAHVGLSDREGKMHSLTRRQFVRRLGVSVGAIGLAACAPIAPAAPTQAPVAQAPAAPTQPPSAPTAAPAAKAPAAPAAESKPAPATAVAA